MFLTKIQQKNPQLIAAAIKLHSQIGPNTYVLDLDAIITNTIKIVKEAQKYNLFLYQMTKQFGRNPLVAKAIANAGIDKVVCVDPWEALQMIKNGISLGNVGHIVQIPDSLIKPILKAKPEVVTVFSIEKTRNISKVAKSLGIKQNVIIRVIDDNDQIYPGQEGGIHLSQLKEFIFKLQKLDNINLIGFTSFPCFLTKNDKIYATKNVITVKKAKVIAEELNIKISHINLPSTNCVKSMKEVAKLGGTHIEPGHALIGTTPSHVISNDDDELPAIIYLSEVSHLYKNNAYFYGGGHYRRSKMENVLVVSDNKHFIEKTNDLNPEAIDYYLSFKISQCKPRPGDIVIASFRTQIFVTRANVAIISGISKGMPQIKGIFNSLGDQIE